MMVTNVEVYENPDEANSLPTIHRGVVLDEVVDAKLRDFFNKANAQAASPGEETRSEGTDQGHMQQRARELAQRLHVPIRVITDTGEFGGMSRRQRNAKGFFDTDTGEMSVIIANHDSVADVESTLFHEAVATTACESWWERRKAVGERSLIPCVY